MQVDRGAIPFVMKGSNIMCPGLTSKGGDCSIDVDKDTVVVSRTRAKEQRVIEQSSYYDDLSGYLC